jgi:hypothetical protein
MISDMDGMPQMYGRSKDSPGCGRIDGTLTGGPPDSPPSSLANAEPQPLTPLSRELCSRRSCPPVIVRISLPDYERRKSRAHVWTIERADTLFVGERVRKTGDCQRDCASNHNEWEAQMAKSARKRRARRKKNANHGKRPNA